MIHTIETASRIIHSSNPKLRIKKVASDLAQVFSEPGVVGLVANLYNDAIVILGPELYHVPLQIQYNDPTFEDKLVERMHLRLYGTEEDYLRFKRQEDVKRYFEQKKEEET